MNEIKISSDLLLKTVKEIESSYPGNYNERQVKALFLAVKQYREKDLSKAVSKIFLDKNYLPTISDIVQYVRIEYEHDYTRTVKTAAETLLRPKHGDKKIAVDVKVLITNMLAGKIDREGYHKELIKLHSKYPRAQFGAAANEYNDKILSKRGPGMPGLKSKPVPSPPELHIVHDQEVNNDNDLL